MKNIREIVEIYFVKQNFPGCSRRSIVSPISRVLHTEQIGQVCKNHGIKEQKKVFLFIVRQTTIQV